jgi:hypothetical protein
MFSVCHFFAAAIAAPANAFFETCAFEQNFVFFKIQAQRA